MIHIIIIIRIITSYTAASMKTINNYHTNLMFKFPTVPGLVQSLNFSSARVSEITIHWDQVDCQHRNGRLRANFYLVVTYPSLYSYSSSSESSARIVRNRMFTLTGLAPLTSYTFEIQALNSNFPPSLPLRGPRASLTVSTTAPEGKLLVTLSYRLNENSFNDNYNYTSSLFRLWFYP